MMSLEHVADFAVAYREGQLDREEISLQFNRSSDGGVGRHADCSR